MKLRRIAVVIHRTLGFALGAFYALLGLTGSVMVFRGNVDAFFDPVPFRISGSMVRLGPDSAVAIARRAAGGGRLSRLDIPRASGGPAGLVYVVRLERARDVTQVYVDPHDGHVLALRAPDSGPTRWVYDLHTTLGLRDAGKNIVGAIGVTLIVVALSGAFLWPGWRDARLGFTLKPRGSALRVSYDVHKICGIAVMAFLVLAASTGVMLTFKAATRALLGVAPPPSVPEHIARKPNLSAAALVAMGEREFPGSEASSISFPAHADRPLVIELRASNDLDEIDGNKRLYVDPVTGALLERVDGMRDPIAGWSELVYAVHTGRIRLNPLPPLILVVVGSSPTVLFITAAIVWGLRTRQIRRRRSVSIHPSPERTPT